VRKLAVVFLLAASCSHEPTQNDTARKALLDWAKSAASGDVEKTLAGFSSAYQSQWLYQRLAENDGRVRRWRGQLEGSPRTALDLWWGQALKRGNGRDEPLNSLVLGHPSFIQLWREYFTAELPTIQTGLSRVEVTETYGDSTGVTVIVKSGPGMPAEYYGLVYEGTSWKIDSYRPGQVLGK